MTVEELRALHNSVWQHHDDGKVCYSTEVRKLTKEELEGIFQSIRELRLPVLFTNSAFGFNVGIKVYEWPAHPGLDMEHVITVGGHHLGLHFNEAWDVLYPVVSAPDNMNMISALGDTLKRMHLRFSLDKGYWAY